MTGEIAPSFTVSDWLVEPALYQISRDGHRVSLPPRAIDLLVLLSTRQNDVVTIDDIIEGVWKGVIVSDSSIYNTIN